jgi:hypothetical protein
MLLVASDWKLFENQKAHHEHAAHFHDFILGLASHALLH